MKTPATIEKPAKATNGEPQDLRSLIANHPFFNELRWDHILALADCAMKTEFRAGELIFREGDPANRFFLILKGKVALEARRKGSEPVLVENIGAGDVLGWSWLVEPYVWHFDARAVELTEAIFFYGTWMREVYEEDGSLGYEMMRRMAAVMLQRLQAARGRLLACAPAKPPVLLETPLKSEKKGNI
jgi:CRP-like cAMP-binding protein